MWHLVFTSKQSFNPTVQKSDFSLHYHYLFKHSSDDNKERDHQGYACILTFRQMILMFSRVLGQKLGMLSSHDSNNKENVSLKTRSSYVKPLRIFLGHVTCLMWQNYNRVFSEDATVAILVYQKQWNGSLIGAPSQSCWGWAWGPVEHFVLFQ